MSSSDPRDPIKRWRGAILLVNLALIAIVAALIVRAMR